MLSHRLVAWLVPAISALLIVPATWAAVSEELLGATAHELQQPKVAPSPQPVDGERTVEPATPRSSEPFVGLSAEQLQALLQAIRASQVRPSFSEPTRLDDQQLQAVVQSIRDLAAKSQQPAFMQLDSAQLNQLSTELTKAITRPQPSTVTTIDSAQMKKVDDLLAKLTESPPGWLERNWMEMARLVVMVLAGLIAYRALKESRKSADAATKALEQSTKSADAAEQAARHRQMVDVQAKLLSDLWALRDAQRRYVQMPQEGTLVAPEDQHVRFLIDAIRQAHVSLYAFIAFDQTLDWKGKEAEQKNRRKLHQLAIDCYWTPQTSSLNVIRKELANAKVVDPTDRERRFNEWPAVQAADHRVTLLESKLLNGFSSLRFNAPKINDEEPVAKFQPTYEQANEIGQNSEDRGFLESYDKVRAEDRIDRERYDNWVATAQPMSLTKAGDTKQP